MFESIFNNDNTHYQGAYEIEMRMRAREEQWLMLPVNVEIQEAKWVKLSANPFKGRLAGILSLPKVLLQTLVGTLSK